MSTEKKPENFGLCIHKQTGIRHEKRGKPCEDFVSSARSAENGVAAVSLSDGAGSCEHAFYGASIAAQEASRLLASDFETLWHMSNDEAAEYLIREICSPITRTAEAQGWSSTSMYATVLCTAKHPDERFIAFHVGDGVITAYSPETGCEVLSQYEHKIAGNVTSFVNEPSPEYKIIKDNKPYASFFMTSDGAEPYLVPSGQVTAPVLLLQQAAFVLSGKSTMHYMSLLMNSICTECYGDDDLSFALLSDFRKSAGVFKDMTDRQFCALMNIDTLPGQTKAFCLKVIEMLHRYPEGMSADALSRILYTHKKSRLMKKLARIFPADDFIDYGSDTVFLK